MAVVDQYAMSVSFAHSLPLFLVWGPSTLCSFSDFRANG